MKVQVFNYILLGFIILLFLMLVFLIYNRLERGQYEISIYPGDDYIQINQLVAFSTKGKYYNASPPSYPEHTIHLLEIFRRYSDYPKTILNTDVEHSYFYPDIIGIQWLNLNERQLWNATLKLPDRYWKDMNKKVYLTIAFKPEGELIVYKSDDSKREEIEIGRYQAERDMNAKWIDLVYEYYAKKLTREQQIDLCIKKYNYGVKILKEGFWEEEVKEVSVLFHRRLVPVMQLREDAKNELENSNMRVVSQLNFVIDSFAYDMLVQPVNLFFALEEMEQDYKEEGADLCLFLLPDEKPELKLISRKSRYEIPIEYSDFYKRKYDKKDSNE